MLHFAYGSNMNRAAMRRRCPTASAIGPARLDGWRFVITRGGYASIVPAPGASVHGLLWQLGPRDLAALNTYEAIDRGLYRRRTILVAGAGGRVPALVYVARDNRAGRPRPGYQQSVVTAARAAAFPARYLRSLARWLPGRMHDQDAIRTGASE